MKDIERQRKKAWKAEQREQARQAFPLPESQLENMFDFVADEVAENGCDHSLRATCEWTKLSGNSTEGIFLWLEENGGYCDCEIAANAYDHFLQNR